MKKIRNEFKYDKSCTIKSIEADPFLTYEKPKRSKSIIELIERTSVRTDEEAEIFFEEVMNSLYKNRFIQETI